MLSPAQAHLYFTHVYRDNRFRATIYAAASLRDERPVGRNVVVKWRVCGRNETFFFRSTINYSPTFYYSFSMCYYSTPRNGGKRTKRLSKKLWRAEAVKRGIKKYGYRQLSLRLITILHKIKPSMYIMFCKNEIIKAQTRTWYLSPVFWLWENKLLINSESRFEQYENKR